MDLLESKLREVFGHEDFREGQRKVMEALLAGRPALALFPTGAGKSLCYQLPALLLDGLTLVVSPLIALMKDQVEALTARGIEAARLDSTLSPGEVRDIYGRMENGRLKLLYAAPERLANEGFLSRLRRTRLGLVAIDEAHCISEWGHNFRPDYLKLGKLTRELGAERVLALTATATPRVAADIRERFGIAEEDHVQTGFRRANLHYRVTPCAAAEKKDLLARRLREEDRPGGATIVYVTLQQTAEEVAGYLTREGFVAKAYHAGLPDEYRAEVQDAFMGGEVDIIVATIAFGMGIDKADIRAVYHYNLPKSLENYAQETGRAGRDGRDSVCEVLACADDRVVLENFVYGDTPSEQASKSLVEHLLLQGESFDISRYDLSVTNDIRQLVVATALAYLELEGVIVPKGPFYAGYRFQWIASMDQVLAGHDEGRRACLEKIFDAAKKGRKWWTVDVREVAEAIGEEPERVRRALNHLGEMGEVIVQPSGLRYGYELDTERAREVRAITVRLQELFANREANEIGRLGLVMRFCEEGGCLTRRLVEYFGERMEEDCGTCGNCVAEGGSVGGREMPRSLPDEVSVDEIATIRSVMDEKHAALRQPRQLARFLCGISSPAASRARLSRHDRFGVLEEAPFQRVLAQVETMLW